MMALPWHRWERSLTQIMAQTVFGPSFFFKEVKGTFLFLALVWVVTLSGSYCFFDIRFMTVTQNGETETSCLVKNIYLWFAKSEIHFPSQVSKTDQYELKMKSDFLILSLMFPQPSSILPTPNLLPLVTANLSSVSRNLVVLEFTYKWNHRVFAFLCLTYFT